jgi:hypothetical protein
VFLKKLSYRERGEKLSSKSPFSSHFPFFQSLKNLCGSLQQKGQCFSPFPFLKTVIFPGRPSSVCIHCQKRAVTPLAVLTEFMVAGIGPSFGLPLHLTTHCRPRHEMPQHHVLAPSKKKPTADRTRMATERVRAG